eukprot:TRINITY_DN3606_c0_g1_i1.p1 TRINITY_DN3606_c0_g1~~TRINITY_DN3606_c0_g1_i1.p1  ORF type:complete len:1271 (+),score=290.21 TRINITY_DN3606_c0_g1_i1:63-3875(+)
MKIRRISMENPPTPTGSDLRPSSLLLSPVTLQMQKHLLSSTIQTMSDTATSGGSIGKGGKFLRNGSCSPTPALPYTPTPSPSPFNSLSLGLSGADLNLSMSGDTKALNFLSNIGDNKSSAFSTSSSSFVDLDVCGGVDGDGAERQANLGHQLPAAALAGVSSSRAAIAAVSAPSFSPTSGLELDSVLNFSGQSHINDQQHHITTATTPSQRQDYLMLNPATPAAVNVPCSSISLLPNTNNLRLLEMSSESGSPQHHKQTSRHQHQPAPPMKIVPVSVTSTINQAAPAPVVAAAAATVDNSLQVVSDIQSCLSPLKSVEGSPITCLTALPSVTSHQQQLTCLSSLSSGAVTSLACLPAIDTLDCLPLASPASTTANPGIITNTASYDHFNSASIVPNKKRRLLTFLTEDNNIEPIVNVNKRADDSTLILNTAEPSGTTLVATTMTKKPIPSTILLSNEPIPLQPQKASSSVCIGPTQPLNKSEQTLIINSDGTPAALITPVNSVPPSQTSTTILAPVSATTATGLVAAARGELAATAEILPAATAELVPAAVAAANHQLSTISISSQPRIAGPVPPVIGPGAPVIGPAAPVVGPASAVVGAAASVTPAVISVPPPPPPPLSLAPSLPLPTAAAIEFHPTLAASSSATFTVDSFGGVNSSGEKAVILNERNNHQDVQSMLSQNDSFPPASSTVLSIQPPNSQFVEVVSMFKCKICCYVNSSSLAIENHLYDEHEKVVGAPPRTKDEANWQQVASKEGVKLNCPQCHNIFSSERSFSVHLTEDHAMSDSQAATAVAKENSERKAKTLNIIRAEKERLRQERKRNRQDGYEAYLDDNGELRIRRIVAGTGGGDEVGVGTRCAVKKEIKLESTSSVELEGDNEVEIDVGNNEEVGHDKLADMSVFDVRATDYIEMVLNKHKTLMEITNQTGGKTASEENGKSIKERPIRPKTGRPKGSKSLGISTVRKLNPKITISDDLMGRECGVDGCAVRLKSNEKLSMHRKCHTKTDNFECTECPSSNFRTWPKCALHMWRAHNQDMELYTCDTCDYKSFFKSTMEKHKKCHTEGQPCLCPECGRSVKNDRQLRDHMRVVHAVNGDGKKLDHVAKYECDICLQTLCSERELRLHKERVHEGKRPWLCTICGFSAFTRSSIDLHIRTHTGEKPYKCKDCDYACSDHNVLRRHSMRHSGEKPYKCPYCPYSSIQSTVYKQHLKKKHPDKQKENLFSCTHCDFVSVQEKLYLSHVKTHLLASPSTPRTAAKNEKKQPPPEDKDNK